MRSLHTPLALIPLLASLACVDAPPRDVAVDEREPVEEEVVTPDPPGTTSPRVLEYGTHPELYGEPLDNDARFVRFPDVLATTETLVGQTFQTEGIVRAVCQVRGCWMEIRDFDNVDSAGMTVRFYDYGFFMPLDSRGADVLIQGEVDYLDLTVEEVAELEAEGYDLGVKNDDGTASILEFTATGVEMWQY
jgi:hypothetical protein